jgi:hypothetical protein
MKQTKENTLYLPIKQVHFDAILAGEKVKEFREIKDTTFQKYLKTWKNADGSVDLDFFDHLTTHEIIAESGNDLLVYNNGVYPYMPKEIKFLNLAVGYAKDRDKATIEVKNITFEPVLKKDGTNAIFIAGEEDIIFDDNGNLCFWQIVYHLGKKVA